MEDRSEPMGISELAERAGVSLRTVRYYVSEGLLPPPGGSRANPIYSYEHLLRLRAIRLLKVQYLPLTEVRNRLEGMSLAELEQLVASLPEEPKKDSAADFLASIMPQGLVVRDLPAPSRRDREHSPPRDAKVSGHSVWHRVALAPGVELHYQPTGDRDRDRVIARLIKKAMDLLGNPPVGTERRPQEKGENL
ncbi:MAG: MerR family transcriptional regulator [Chloroflexia bacterium]|nr:MerR family transcriptional regulator [Chloroflexia bacterium]